MLTPPRRIIQDRPPELLAIFDLLYPGAHSLLRGICRAWGSSAAVENLGYGRVVLTVRPGGALGLAR